MSGGYFDYDQYKIGQIADSLEQIILDPHEIHRYSDDVIIRFKEGLSALKVAQVYAQRIDWLISGDDGEESFLSRLNNDLGKL